MTTLEECRARDRADPLARFADAFAPGPPGTIYLDANSLGAMPRSAPERVAKLLAHGWVEQRRRSWSELDWIAQPRALGAGLAHLIGAAPEDVIVCDTTTVNLHKLLSFGLAVAAPRRVIVAEREVFPTDLYVAEGLARQAGRELRLVDGPDDLPAALDGDVAIVCLSLVDYRSSRRWDMAEVGRLARERGVLTLWDLSHGAGAVAIDLRGADADFAVGCGYKYLSGGPGAPALLYVNPRHGGDVWPAIPGWFGHADTFAFSPGYVPAPGVGRHLAGSPAVLANAAFGAAVEIWRDVSPAELDAKHASLSELAIALVEERCGAFGIAVVSPRDHARQGGHVALRHPEAESLVHALLDAKVVCSYRKPGSIRFGLGPLALGHADIWTAVDRLHAILAGGTWRGMKSAKSLA